MSTNKKIPYDPTPISRGGSTKAQKSQPKASFKFKALVLAVFVFNVAVLVLLICSVASNKSKTINMNYQVTSNSAEISIAASAAKLSSVVVQTNESSGSNVNFGAGVIYSIENDTAYIITCYHVVEKAATSDASSQITVYVYLYDNQSAISAEIVGYLVDEDVAILKIKNNIVKSSYCQAATLADSTYITEGDTVFAIGNPLNSGISVTSGVISEVSTIISGTKIRSIKIDAAVNPGNSGGGIFDASGKLLGIVRSKSYTVISGGTNIPVDNTAYALPINKVKSITKGILQNYKSTNTCVTEFDYASAGFTAIIDSTDLRFIDGKYYKFYKCKVSSVETNSQAYAAGLQDEDILLSVTVDGITYDFVATYVFEDIKYSITSETRIIYKVQHQNGNIDYIAYTFTP